MSSDIRVVDPATVEQTNPVPGLAVRTLFQVADRRLALLRIEDESGWHYYGRAIYGWIRAGGGRLLSGGLDRPTELSQGDFIRIPAEAIHRYIAGVEALEILVVVEKGVGPAPPEPSTMTDVAAEPNIVGTDELVPTVESPALTRETPFPDEEDVLLMRVTAAGGAAAGWHHHGDNTYFGYAVDGPSETEYGRSNDEVTRIELGECFHVPSGLVHRDTNPADETHTGIIWLCGGEPWVINVDSPE